MSRKIKRVVTYGTFDLFHVGHVRLLERLSRIGDELIVFVSTDEFNKIKGKTCVMPFAQRAELVGSCKYVTKVMPERDWEQKRNDILREGAEVFAMGDDWSGKFDHLSDICEVIYLPRTEDISSTFLKMTISDMAAARANGRSLGGYVTPDAAITEKLFEEILEMARNDELDKKNYRRFASILTENENEKDTTWLRCWILLNCLMRKKAVRTQASIARLNRLSRRKGMIEQYQAFMKLLFDELNLLRPIGSKYSESFGGKNIAEILAECGRVSAALEADGLKIFANSGTLLGLIREGKLLDHDNDIDFGVLLDATDVEAAATEWLALCERMIARGRAVSRSQWSGVTLKLHKIHSFGVDLFPAWIDKEGRLFIFPHTNGSLSGDQLLPFRLETLSGLKLPKDSEAVLASNYGNSWQQPEEGWNFNWEDARVNFSKFLSLLPKEAEGSVNGSS